MKTLTLLSILLAVASGKPFEQQEPPVLPPQTLQRPLVGDLLPAQGHVVEENPAPKPQLGKELQLSAPRTDDKEETSVQVQEEDVNVEEPSVNQDLTEDKNEIEQEGEEVSLASELDEQDMEGLQGNGEMMNDIVEEDEEKDSVQELEDHNEIDVKYDFEQPIMELEPLTNEEMERDELLEVSQGMYEEPVMYLEPSKGVYEEPVMYVEPEAVEGQTMSGKDIPDALMAMEEEGGPMLDPQGEPLQQSDNYFPLDEEFMRLEPLESEDQPQVLQYEEPVANGERSCSGVVLEGKCFQFFTNPKKASDAEYFCQKSFYGGHLASITSQNIHNEMMNLMKQSGGTRRTWVGGIRFLDTGRFVWLDGSRWDFADWLRGEPNNTANLEDCIEVLASGKFNDFTCWEPQAFICSYPYQ